MPRNLVLFDLEWNIGYQPYTFNYHGVQQTFRGEIVEIGAVKIDEDANVLDTFSIHLRPRIFRKLQHHIAKVTGLTQADLDKGEPIVQGLRRFMQWCGPDAEFAEWGMDDVPVLKQNLFLCNIDESRPTVWYDLQQVFLREHPRKEGEGMTLESVVTRMGIPMERQFHDALSAFLRIGVRYRHCILRRIPVSQTRAATYLDKRCKTRKHDIYFRLIEVPGIDERIHSLIRRPDLQLCKFVFPILP